MKKIISILLMIAVITAIAIPKSFAVVNEPLVIVLDPGHGATSSGAHCFDTSEKDINMTIAKYMKEELDKYHNVEIYLTHDDTEYLDLEQRAAVAASYNADLLVSLHANSEKTNNLRGSEVYYPNANYIDNYNTAVTYEQTAELAHAFQEGLTSLGIKDRGVFIRNSDNSTLYADGSLADYYGILREPKELGIPAILIEHAYMNNSSDFKAFLNTDEKLKKLAMSNANAIIEAFDLKIFGVTEFTITAPEKTEYMIGENLDKNGIVVKAKYSDGTSKTLSSSDYSLSGFDSESTGNKIVKISHMDAKSSFVVCVLEKGSSLNSSLVGDVNGDGEIKASDYLIIKDSFLNGMVLSDTQISRADVKEDGTIKASDYLMIKDYFLGKLDSLRDPVATATPEPTTTVTPVPTVEPSATAEPTVTPTPTAKPTIEPTVTPTPTTKPTIEPTVTPTATDVPTATPAPTPTVEPEPAPPEIPSVG